MSNPLGLDRRLPLAALTQDDLFGTDDREELAHAYGKSLLNQRVIDPIGVPALENQSGVLEDTQVPRDRWAADREPRTYLTSRELTSLEILEDLTSGGVSEGSETSGIVIHVST